MLSKLSTELIEILRATLKCCQNDLMSILHFDLLLQFKWEDLQCEEDDHLDKMEIIKTPKPTTHHTYLLIIPLWLHHSQSVEHKIQVYM